MPAWSNHTAFGGTGADRRENQKRCCGAPTGSSCWKEPYWGIFDTHRGGKPDRYACDRHLHNAIDRERGGLVVNAEHH